MATQKELPVKAVGYAANDTTGVLSLLNFSRRATGEHDVQFKVTYCGICHSDLHSIKNEWASAQYPMVPGHEMVGIVTEVGSKVQRFKVGDKIGVGVMVNSCRKCDQCTANLENYCHNAIFTYNSIDVDGTMTYGGYSNIMVANEDFVIRWPENFPEDIAVPLLCAGITTYSPLRYYGLDKPGMNIGVVGLGGLGHVAVKFAKAFGARVTAISNNPNQHKEALELLGADAFLNNENPEDMQKATGTLDGILDAVAAKHPLQPLLGLLKTHGKLVLVGLPEKPLEVPASAVVHYRRMIGGSMIGGLKETQEMIDFAAKHNILPNVEKITMDYVNTAMERLERGDVKYRFVIDVANSFKSA